jgi:hypothetical protein
MNSIREHWFRFTVTVYSNVPTAWKSLSIVPYRVSARGFVYIRLLHGNTQ